MGCVLDEDHGGRREPLSFISASFLFFPYHPSFSSSSSPSSHPSSANSPLTTLQQLAPSHPANNIHIPLVISISIPTNTPKQKTTNNNASSNPRSRQHVQPLNPKPKRRLGARLKKPTDNLQSTTRYRGGRRIVYFVWFEIDV